VFPDHESDGAPNPQIKSKNARIIGMFTILFILIPRPVMTASRISSPFVTKKPASGTTPNRRIFFMLATEMNYDRPQQRCHESPLPNHRIKQFT